MEGDNLTFVDSLPNCTDVRRSSNLFEYKLQISWQLIAASIGLPLNLVVLYRLFVAQWRRSSGTRILALYSLLNVSNIGILLAYCVGLSVWQLTFWWESNDLVCKLYKFLDTFFFYLSSNTTVSIAIDLCYSLQSPLLARINAAVRVQVLVAVSLILSCLTTLPQVFVWGTFEAECVEGGFRRQCVFLYDYSHGVLIGYSVLHNAILFWIPLCVIAPCYALATKKAYEHFRTEQQMPKELREAKQPRRKRERAEQKTDDEVRKNSLKIRTQKLSTAILRKSFGGMKSMSMDGQAKPLRDKRTRILMSSFLIVTAYILSWLPYQVSSVFELWVAAEHLQSAAARYLKFFAEALMIIDTLINPFLYKLTAVNTTNGSERRPDTSRLDETVRRGRLASNPSCVLSMPRETYLSPLARRNSANGHRVRMGSADSCSRERDSAVPVEKVRAFSEYL